MKTSNKIVAGYLIFLALTSVTFLILNLRENRRSLPLAREIMSGLTEQRFRVIDYRGNIRYVFHVNTDETLEGPQVMTWFSLDAVSIVGDTLRITSDMGGDFDLPYRPEVFINGNPFGKEE